MPKRVNRYLKFAELLHQFPNNGMHKVPSCSPTFHQPGKISSRRSKKTIMTFLKNPITQLEKLEKFDKK
jgi:hypothetical protein